MKWILILTLHSTGTSAGHGALETAIFDNRPACQNAAARWKTQVGQATSKYSALNALCVPSKK